MRLQHNIMAKSAYRSYTKNTSAMKKNLERLASGYKINRAADDAAGLAISEKMRAQITGEETAQKNARDGISLVQTAEGALAEVHDMLDRMVELAVQSANGTYEGATDRAQLQKEMDQLMKEIDRIADNSNFNGLPLLDGSMDGGGDTVYDPSPVGSIELPGVGKTPGESTVLHTDSATEGNNVFSVGLHSIILNANSSISIAVGNNITITVTNNSDKAVTAEDIAAAIAGDSSKNISVDYDDANVGKSEDGNVTLTVNGNSVFELKASGSYLIFTQTGGSDVKMPQEVTITDATPPPPKVEGSGSISPGTDADGRAKYTIDLSSVDMTAPGNVTVELLGKKFDLKITDAEFNGNRSVGQLLAEKLTNALNAANLPDDISAGALSFTDNRDGTISLVFGNPNETPEQYNVDSVSVTTSVYQDGGTGTMVVDMTVGEPGSSVLGVGSASVTIDGVTYEFTLVTPDYAGSGYDLTADDVVFVGQNEDYRVKLAEKLNVRLAKQNEENKASNKTYNEYVNTEVNFVDGELKVKYEYVVKRYIGITGGPDSPGGPGGPDDPEVTVDNFSGYYDPTTTVLQRKQTDANGSLASTVIDLKPEMMADRSALIIGGKEYTFTTDRAHTDRIIANKDNLVYVGDLDLSTQSGLKTAIDRLTVVAEGNGVWSVGYGGEGGKVTLREKVKGGAGYMDGGDPEFDLRTLDGVKASLGWRAATPEAKNGKAMTLQIGDSSDSYNQLQFSIRDCHTAALGIANVSIAEQESAKAAVSVIRAAVNYISDVRGTLGATQNRLDHTINNLSVMAENIQDAESTIRDADVAEDMMAYTKNNILIQSSQAMLAQANQVPQSVMQLLQ